MLTCFLDEDEWINLDHIRTFQYEKEPELVVMVIWTNGDRSIYRGDKAAYLLANWIEVVEVETGLRLTS